MKTKSLWFATAAAVVLTGMTMMTSCSKDEPLLPEVIESEVYDEGEAGEVRAEVGTEGTQLSYESWIMVRGITRASFDKKVSVTLNNAFNNVDSVIEVGSFNLGECCTELVYEAANSRRQNFVTVTDLLLMYKVTFDVFSFSYNLYHEIGIYDDGITRQTMPYHPIGNIRDNGYTLTDLDFIIEDNGEGEQVVYLRKRFDHSVSLDFNGKTYTLPAKIELRLYAGAHPAVVSSGIVNSGLGNIEHNLWTSRYTSWVEVKHRYSDGSIGNKTYTIENMRTEIDADIEKYKAVILPAMYVADEKLLKRLKDYTMHGGTLIATFKTAFANENVKVYPDRQPHILNEVFGIYYQQFTFPKNVTLTGFESGAPEAEHFMELLMSEGAETVLSYQHSNWKKYAAVTRHAYGKGEAWYIGCMFEEKYLQQLFARILGENGIHAAAP